MPGIRRGGCPYKSKASRNASGRPDTNWRNDPFLRQGGPELHETGEGEETLNMETVTNAIEVDHLTKKFGDFVAVDDVSFNVAHQEIFGLLGPNGAGKTTLIRMMTTLLAVTSGTARIGGHDIRTDADGVRNTLGVIPQAFTSDPELTAKENMAIHAKLYGVASDKRDALIDGLLESVELLKFRDSLVRTFSGGMRRRLEIARGLVAKAQTFGSTPAIVENLGAADADLLQAIADALKGQFKGVVVLGGAANNAVALVATVAPELTKKFQAGKIIQAIAPIVGGKGGGRPDNARGGGKDASKLDEALAKAKSLLG